MTAAIAADLQPEGARTGPRGLAGRTDTLTIILAGRADRVPHRRASAAAVGAVLVQLGADAWRRGGTSRATAAEVAEWVGLSVRTVQSAFRDLTEAGVVRSMPRDGQRTARTLNSDRLEALARTTPRQGMHPGSACGGARDAGDPRTGRHTTPAPAAGGSLDEQQALGAQKTSSGAPDGAAGRVQCIPSVAELVKAVEEIAAGLNPKDRAAACAAGQRFQRNLRADVFDKRLRQVANSARVDREVFPSFVRLIVGVREEAFRRDAAALNCDGGADEGT